MSNKGKSKYEVLITRVSDLNRQIYENAFLCAITKKTVSLRENTKVIYVTEVLLFPEFLCTIWKSEGNFDLSFKNDADDSHKERGVVALHILNFARRRVL